MEVIKKHGNRLSAEEKETHLYYDPVDKIWVMDSTIPKHFNKALRQKWEILKEYKYDDDSIFGMVLRAPEKSITIRNTEKKQMSERQLENLNTDDGDEE